jgi:hypothetical protein
VSRNITRRAAPGSARCSSVRVPPRGRERQCRWQAIAKAEAVRGKAARPVKAPTQCLYKTPGQKGCGGADAPRRTQERGRLRLRACDCLRAAFKTCLAARPRKYAADRQGVCACATAIAWALRRDGVERHREGKPARARVGDVVLEPRAGGRVAHHSRTRPEHCRRRSPLAPSEPHARKRSRSSLASLRRSLSASTSRVVFRTAPANR